MCEHQRHCDKQDVTKQNKDDACQTFVYRVRDDAGKRFGLQKRRPCCPLTTQDRNLTVKRGPTEHSRNNPLVARAVTVTTQREARVTLRHIFSHPEQVRTRANSMVYRVEMNINKLMDRYDDD